AWWGSARINLRLNQAQLGETIIAGIKVTKSSVPVQGQPMIDTQPSPLQPTTFKRRGRTPKHDWPQLMAQLAVKLSEDGCPGPGEQAELEVWAASRMSTHPVESEIRRYVVQAIAAHRRNIG
ncbi:MAG: hypothetical protein RQ966_16900, partial [Acetobacteraceae bacterium]|nr:hypothetical protein [Acetobacteraceae bacterium]